MRQIVLLQLTLALTFFSACTKKTKTSISRTPSQEISSGTIQPSTLRQRLGLGLVNTGTADSPLESSIATLTAGSDSITMSASCNNFIRENGGYGLWGQRLIRSMRQVNTAPEELGTAGTYFGDGPNLAMGNHCKSLEHFQSLTQQQQEHVWVTLFATISNDTSECSVEKTEDIDEVTYDGLFQLPYHTDDREKMGMENRFCPRHANTTDLRFQANCAVVTLARNSLNRDSQRPPSWRGLDSSNQGGSLWRVLAEHPYCQ